MEIIERIDEDLECYEGSSMIYELDQSEKDAYYIARRKILESNTEFLDIVIDQEDFTEILFKFYNTDDKYKEYLMGDYLLEAILDYVEIKYNKRYKLRLDYAINALNKKCEEFGKIKTRIHIFLDENTDALLQTRINDLIASKSLTIIGYTTKPLITYKKSMSQDLLAPFDYSVVESDRKRQSKQRNKNQFGD